VTYLLDANVFITAKNLFFLPLEPAAFAALGTVASWAQGQGKKQAAVHTFLGAADCYLVAQALAGGHVVVTHERPAASPKKIKIPDACLGTGVKYMSPFERLRAEGARFVLGPAQPGGRIP
jgi:hypothetical protein